MTKYETLANKLRSKIISGVYKEGDMLPSENELVVSEKLSRQTVRKALACWKARAGFQGGEEKEPSLSATGPA